MGAWLGCFYAKCGVGVGRGVGYAHHTVAIPKNLQLQFVPITYLIKLKGLVVSDLRLHAGRSLPHMLFHLCGNKVIKTILVGCVFQNSASEQDNTVWLQVFAYQQNIRLHLILCEGCVLQNVGIVCTTIVSLTSTHVLTLQS